MPIIFKQTKHGGCKHFWDLYLIFNDFPFAPFESLGAVDCLGRLAHFFLCDRLFGSLESVKKRPKGN